MAKIEVGKPYSFMPSAFMGEQTGSIAGKKSKRVLQGTIVWINYRHRFFLVEAKIHDRYLLRECFKF